MSFLKILTPSHFNVLLKESISLDHLYILYCIKEKVDISIFNTAKHRGLIQGLQRRFFINKEKEITAEGLRVFELLKEVEADPSFFKNHEKADKENDPFEIWWLKYPATDAIIIDKKVLFKPTRALRANKDETRLQFKQVLMEGYTLEQLLRTLEYEVHIKIDRSVKVKENKLSYMQNSATYLRQRTFIQFLEISEMDSVTEQKRRTGIVSI